MIPTILSRVDLIISYILTVASLVSFIIAMVKAIKNKKFNEVKDLAIGFIEEAEKLTSKNGDAVAGQVKKEVVLSKIRTICSNVNYKYKEEVWSKVIDEYVELTLKVNQRTVDKTKLENRARAEAEEKARLEAEAQAKIEAEKEAQLPKTDNIVIEEPKQ